MVTLRAVPATEEISVGGWTIRAHGGPWRRVNSVQTFSPPTGDVRARIAECEELYRERGMRTLFKLTPASQPFALDRLLEDSGYRHEAPTRVMTRELDGPPGPRSFGGDRSDAVRPPVPVEIELFGELDDRWIEAAVSWEDEWRPHVGELREMLRQIRPERRFALARGPDGPVATGLAVLDGRCVGLFDLLTQSAFRGRGIGTRVVHELLDWARGAGARTAYLQVMDDNVGARRLYSRLGFEDAYPYWFRLSGKTLEPADPDSDREPAGR
jgi:GNAT superfamily N-acetyltransferase